MAAPDGLVLPPTSNPKTRNFNRPVRAASDTHRKPGGPRSREDPLPFEKLSDHYIIRMYEAIGDEARTDARSGLRLLGEPARERAEQLRQEIERRGLFCTPIEWPAEV